MIGSRSGKKRFKKGIGFHNEYLRGRDLDFLHEYNSIEFFDGLE
jgi:hypothetical protein